MGVIWLILVMIEFLGPMLNIVSDVCWGGHFFSYHIKYFL